MSEVSQKIRLAHIIFVSEPARRNNTSTDVRCNYYVLLARFAPLDPFYFAGSWPLNYPHPSMPLSTAGPFQPKILDSVTNALLLTAAAGLSLSLQKQLHFLNYCQYDTWRNDITSQHQYCHYMLSLVHRFFADRWWRGILRCHCVRDPRRGGFVSIFTGVVCDWHVIYQ